MARQGWLLCAAWFAACTSSPSGPAADGGAQADAVTSDQPGLADTADVADAPDDVPLLLDVVQADAGPDVVDAVADVVTDETAPVDAADAVADKPQDAVDAGAEATSCTPGTHSCQGPLLGTCGPKGDGWIVSKCFPGTACIDGGCKAVSNNLILIFDTSGSMTTGVTKKGSSQPLCSGNYEKWPDCESPTKYPDGCTRIGVSKAVFQKALAKLDDQVTHMALFRFPQTGGFSSCGGGSFGCSCSSGGYDGNDTVSQDNNAQSVGANDAWFWNNLGQIACVEFPKAKGDTTKDKITLWMDNVQGAGNPELRATGGTPIGKSLFYIGEYIRNRVVVDGKKCTVDGDCGNANYVCQGGACKDPVRSCRDTIVVLFTDGGEDSTNEYFGPWVQAKRMSMGLGCNADVDCVGGSACQSFKECVGTGSKLGSGVQCNTDADCKDDKGASLGTCKAFQQCLPTAQVTGYFCSQGGQPCLPGVPAKLGDGSDNPSYCSGQCTKDPRIKLTVTAAKDDDNVLRSPDGKPFGVRLYIVDIGSTTATDISNSNSLAISGGGRLLGADASDPAAFLGALDAAFDLKNKNVCGQ